MEARTVKELGFCFMFIIVFVLWRIEFSGLSVVRA